MSGVKRITELPQLDSMSLEAELPIAHDGVTYRIKLRNIKEMVAGEAAGTFTKEYIGLDKVDNTPDAEKPISTATQAALDDKADKTHSHTVEQVSGLKTTLDALQSDLDGLVKDMAGKAATGHGHAISDITGLAAELSGKATEDYVTETVSSVVSEAVKNVVTINKIEW